MHYDNLHQDPEELSNFAMKDSQMSPVPLQAFDETWLFIYLGLHEEEPVSFGVSDGQQR